MRITRRAQAEAVLSDPRYVPPPVRQDGEPGTLAWLRARVSRFSTGPAHAERRARVTGRLATVDPAELRPAARAMTLERGGDWRGVPTAVLGAALGVADTSAVAAAAAGYLSGEESPEADAAVAQLLDQAGLPEITLLLQGHAATEALIENALRNIAPGDDVEARLRETLKDDPPLTLTRRLDTRTGDEVTIDLVAANRDPAGGDSPHLTFGHGLRPCPAPAHALALAAGVLDALLDPDPDLDPDLDPNPNPNLDPDRGHGHGHGHGHVRDQDHGPGRDRRRARGHENEHDRGHGQSDGWRP